MTARILDGSLVGLPFVFFDLAALRAVSSSAELHDISQDQEAQGQNRYVVWK